MKKSFILILGCIISLFSSCLKKPDAPDGVSTKVVYSFKGGKDMTSLFDFKATYKDAKNNSVTENINSLPWSKTITAMSPFLADMEISFSKKGNIPNKNSYDIGFQGDITYSKVSTKAQIAGRPNYVESNSAPVIFSVDLPEGISADNVNLSVSPLKYNKHFAFTYTADDAVEGAYARIFRRIHKKWIDDQEFFHMNNKPSSGYVPDNTLSMTDGCGNERRFGFGVAILPTSRNAYNNYEPLMQETSESSIYITWDELETILDFGGSVYLHNTDETMYNNTVLEQISEGLIADYNKVLERLNRSMKVMALPDGNSVYLAAARASDNVCFTRSSISGDNIYLKQCGNLYKKETYGGEKTSEVTRKLNELAEQSISDNPYWVGITSHRVDLNMMRMLEQVYELYGRAGQDNLWVASWDEIYEYVAMREGADIRKSVNGRRVTFEVRLPVEDNFYYKDISFLLNGVDKNLEVTPLSDNIYGLSHAFDGTDELINVNFNTELPLMAEKYTAKYEASSEIEDKDDAMYFISTLLPELAAPYLERIGETANNPLSLKKMTVNGGESSVYNNDIEVAFEFIGKATHYRIGETADLSDAKWIDYADNNVVKYSLEAGFGDKTIYMQMKNAVKESVVLSSKIKYSDVPESGSVPRSGAEAYVKKYDSYKAKFSKEITGK